MIDARNELDKLSHGSGTYRTCGTFSDPDRNISACTDSMGLGDGLDELIQLEARGRAYPAKGDLEHAILDLHSVKEKFPKDFLAQKKLDQACSAVPSPKPVSVFAECLKTEGTPQRGRRKR
jgi:hypothetical protein